MGKFIISKPFTLALAIICLALVLFLHGSFGVRNVAETMGTTLPATCTTGDQHCDTGNGVTYRCRTTDTWEAVSIPPAYGQLYEDNVAGSTISITTGDTYYQWVTSTAGASNLATLSTANDNITIDAGGAGVYEVVIQMSYLGTASEIFTWRVFVDGSQTSEVSSARMIGASGDAGSQSAVGLLTLADADVVDLRVSCPTSTTSVTVRHVSLTLERVGI